MATIKNWDFMWIAFCGFSITPTNKLHYTNEIIHDFIIETNDVVIVNWCYNAPEFQMPLIGKDEVLLF